METEVIEDSQVKTGELISKHPGGRPTQYKSSQEMESAIEQYFRDCHLNRTEIDSGEFNPDRESCTDNLRPTVSGLALVLGLSGRQAILNYSKRDEFVDVIKAARLRIESYLEDRLYDGAPAGAIFGLKNNYGWRDEKHLSIDNQEVKKVIIVSADQSRIAQQLAQAAIESDISESGES